MKFIQIILSRNFGTTLRGLAKLILYKSDFDSMIANSKIEFDTLISKYKNEFYTVISESKIEFDTVISESTVEFDTVISESKSEFDTVISESKNEFDTVISEPKMSSTPRSFRIDSDRVWIRFGSFRVVFESFSDRFRIAPDRVREVVDAFAKKWRESRRNFAVSYPVHEPQLVLKSNIA